MNPRMAFCFFLAPLLAACAGTAPVPTQTPWIITATPEPPQATPTAVWVQPDECSEPETIVYLAESELLNHDFEALDLLVDKHIEERAREKVIRADVQTAIGYKSTRERHMTPPSFLEDYNALIVSAYDLRTREIMAKWKGDAERSAIYREAIESLEELAKNEWAKAYIYCGWQ